VNGYCSGLSAGELGEGILAGLDRVAELRAGCLRTAREYRWEEIVRRIEAVYDRCVGDASAEVREGDV